MNRICCLKSLPLRPVVVLFVALALTAPSRRADAETVVFDTGIDNTLYQYDPGKYDADKDKSWIKSNGQGNYFAAGRTLSKSQLQRALIKFDLSPGLIPANKTVGSASLKLYVVDAPQNDQTPRDFWLVSLPQVDQAWGEGSSNADIYQSGSGKGADATLGDATWYHTQYDPSDANHYDADLTPISSPWVYHPSENGFWPEESVTSPAGLALELGQGALGDDAFSLPGTYAPAVEDVGGSGMYVTLSSDQMAADIQAWLDNPDANFGWILLGDESVVGDDVSSKRGFASFDHTTAAFRPTLSVGFVPEPAVWVHCLILAVVLGGYTWRRRRRAA